MGLMSELESRSQFLTDALGPCAIHGVSDIDEFPRGSLFSAVGRHLADGANETNRSRVPPGPWAESGSGPDNRGPRGQIGIFGYTR